MYATSPARTRARINIQASPQQPSLSAESAFLIKNIRYVARRTSALHHIRLPAAHQLASWPICEPTYVAVPRGRAEKRPKTRANR